MFLMFKILILTLYIAGVIRLLKTVNMSNANKGLVVTGALLLIITVLTY